jgi:hypothetical protein
MQTLVRQADCDAFFQSFNYFAELLFIFLPANVPEVN